MVVVAVIRIEFGDCSNGCDGGERRTGIRPNHCVFTVFNVEASLQIIVIVCQLIMVKIELKNIEDNVGRK